MEALIKPPSQSGLHLEALSPSQRIHARVNAISNPACRMLLMAKDLLKHEKIDPEEYHYIRDIYLLHEGATSADIKAMNAVYLEKLMAFHTDYTTLSKAHRTITRRIIDLEFLKP